MAMSHLISFAAGRPYLGVPGGKLRVTVMTFNVKVNVNAAEGRAWAPKQTNTKSMHHLFFTKWAPNGVHMMNIGRIGAIFLCESFVFRKYAKLLK